MCERTGLQLRRERKYCVLDGEVRLSRAGGMTFYHMQCRLIDFVSASWPRHVSGHEDSVTCSGLMLYQHTIAMIYFHRLVLFLSSALSAPSCLNALQCIHSPWAFLPDPELSTRPHHT